LAQKREAQEQARDPLDTRRLEEEVIAYAGNAGFWGSGWKA
jgi:hypothetical protein